MYDVDRHGPLAGADLVVTAEEIWRYLPGQREESVFLSSWAALPGGDSAPSPRIDWDKVLSLRGAGIARTGEIARWRRHRRTARCGSRRVLLPGFIRCRATVSATSCGSYLLLRVQNCMPPIRDRMTRLRRVKRRQSGLGDSTSVHQYEMHSAVGTSDRMSDRIRRIRNSGERCAVSNIEGPGRFAVMSNRKSRTTCT